MPAPRRSNGFLPPVCKKPTMVFENFVGLYHQTKQHQQQLQQQVTNDVDSRFIPWRQRLLQEIATIVDEHSKDADLAIKGKPQTSKFNISDILSINSDRDDVPWVVEVPAKRH